MRDLQQQPNGSRVAVQNLPGAARGESTEVSRPERTIMGPISGNMSLFPSDAPLSLAADLEN